MYNLHSPPPPPNYKLPKAVQYKNLLLTCPSKYPSVDKPLQKLAPWKGPLKNISPGAYYFSEFYGRIRWNEESIRRMKNSIQRSIS